MRIISFVLFIILMASSISCSKEYPSPYPAEEDLYKTADGLLQVIVGMKYRYAVNGTMGIGALFNAITANGFTTNEIVQTGGSNQDYNQLAKGKSSLLPSNGVITELWSNCLLVNSTASKLIINSTVAKDLSLQNQIIKYASLYKAMAIGTMSVFWEKIPVSTGKNAEFVNGKDALKIAINLLDEAYLLNGSLPQGSPYIGVLGNEIDLQNSLAALSARYNLMLGNYDMAITKVNQISSTTSRSTFIFNLQNPNPVFRSGFASQAGYSPKLSFGLTAPLIPATSDGRTPFYTPVPVSSIGPGYGFGNSDTTSFPLYLPGEMLLIQAEAYVHKNDFVNGKKFLDLVLTKTSAQDPFRVGAGLPAYSGAMDGPSLLNEIYKNRCIELFMSGLKLEDSRRFGRPGPNDINPERNRTYYPYPAQERFGNPNTPPDPKE
jgi:starch-binding outer membrane protein, SusD/RagB family